METKTQKDINGKLLCLKEALIRERVSTKSLAAMLNDCIPYASMLGLKNGDLIQACNVAIKAFQVNGIKSFEGNDETREEICRIVFGIPLKNLRRKEERILPTNPAESAAFDEMKPTVQMPIVPIQPKPQVKAVSNVPTYSIEEYCEPDMDAYEGYIGNADIVATAERQISGSELRGDALRPFLLRGASGCGKTEVARRTSRRRGKHFVRLAASVLKSGEDVIALLNEIPNGSTVLIDECHTLSAKPEAVIYDITSNGFKDQDGKAKEFFFMFATNLSGKLADALKNRCTELKLKDYTESELSTIAELTAKDNGVSLESGVSEYIAKRSHGVARYAVEYCKDIIIETAADKQAVTLADTKEFFARRGIDGLGLKDEHRQYVRQLAALGQASSHSLAAALGENDVTEVQKSIEPLLLKHGLIAISSRGRYLTAQGQSYAQALLQKGA